MGTSVSPCRRRRAREVAQAQQLLRRRSVQRALRDGVPVHQRGVHELVLPGHDVFAALERRVKLLAAGSLMTALLLRSELDLVPAV